MASDQQPTVWNGKPPLRYGAPGMPHWLDAGAMPDGSRTRFVALWSGWRWVTPEGDGVRPDEAAAYDWRYVRAMVEPVDAD